ncbi:MAG: hypothetical protein ACM3PT_05245 [Deltaproteobacteria bacterium]
MYLNYLMALVILLGANMSFLNGQCITSYTSSSGGDFATGSNWIGGIAPANPIPPGVTVTISHSMTNSGILENNGTITLNAPGSFTNNAGAIFRGDGTFNGEFINNGTMAPGSTVVLPVLFTTTVNSIAGITATSGGTICYDGGETLSGRGVCWSTSPIPTVGLPTKTVDAGNPFVSNMTGLNERTTYYVRAYATNSAGTAYGNELTFTTNCGPVTFTYNGSSVTYSTVVSANNRCWLDRNLGAAQVATSSTDVASYGDLFQWGRLDDGHQVRTTPTSTAISNSDVPGHNMFILGFSNYYFDWRAPQNNNLWQGENGTNNPCPDGYRLPTDSEWNTEKISWPSNNAAGAFASPIKLPMAGWREHDNGTLYAMGAQGFYWSSTTNVYTSYFIQFYSNSLVIDATIRSRGYSVRCIREEGPEGLIGSLDCGVAVITGTLTQGVAASGVSASVPYTGGNGGSHAGQTVVSTGVTGLTAFLYPGVFNNGSGSLIYSISGTPSGSGTASFALDIGGQTCNLEIPVTFICGTSTVSFNYNGSPVTYGTVISAGRCWLDRNLGATQVATSSTDVASYGDLFQWGRFAEGHQVRTSGTTSTNATTPVPNGGHSWDGLFIPEPNSPYDWLSVQDNDLWQGVNGMNNPCPDGYRLPTQSEWDAERISWSISSASSAYASPLKLTVAGARDYLDGSIDVVGSYGLYWSSSVGGIGAWVLMFVSYDAYMYNDRRALGFSVRCIKD